MFQKVLVANRGESAVRIIRACRDLGVRAVALYEAEDQYSLHVRLANECVPLKAERAFQDQDAILQVAKETGVDAIHPGYGYLAERLDFARKCAANGIVLIGPDREPLDRLQNRMEVLQFVRAQGFPTPFVSGSTFGLQEIENVSAEADELGYPLFLKSCCAGLRRSTHFVRCQEHLHEALRREREKYSTNHVELRYFLEKAIVPAHRVRVQILGDHHGNRIHLGERDASLQYHQQGLFEESPSPCLTPAQRDTLWQRAMEVAGLFDLCGVGTVEFLVGQDGRFFFTEIKTGLQVGHPVTEIVSSIDLVAEQIRIAAGEVLRHRQDDICLRGWGMQCQIDAVNPLRDLVSSPGHIQHVRLPSGPFVRVDTSIDCESDVPTGYGPTLAKLIVFGTNREDCIQRMRRALEEFYVLGIHDNKIIHQHLMENVDFVRGDYTTESPEHLLQENEDITSEAAGETRLRDLAVAVAINYVKRNTVPKPSIPDRLLTGWHRDSRRWKP